MQSLRNGYGILCRDKEDVPIDDAFAKEIIHLDQLMERSKIPNKSVLELRSKKNEEFVRRCYQAYNGRADEIKMTSA